ncbi:helix-turn-helix domain-containing protein [Allokutzneria albata]|uniref:PucR C-terminal helix-turn-helix domain-containing protein n=1 Tax=Allokutzneria albata TaxID=211114 RepID=A0A1G9XN88_ALLAB|nr:helix-turn-helix domain-containing protein [Allokutzneria albata]SDM97665.1 PucR C-terminal helix-turn-helix domain-containing protein [Allokutzneria albata]
MPTQNQLRAMQREVSRQDGLRHLLQWLAHDLDASVVLLDAGGVPLHSFRETPLPQEASEAIARVTAGRSRSATAETPDHVVRALLVDDHPGPVLVLAQAKREGVGTAGPLIADAARLLQLRWRLDRAEERLREVELAETLAREAVLHLLMVGDVGAARRVAGALRPDLTDLVRVYVIECPLNARDEVAARCDEACLGRAWIIHCPVYTRHLIVLAPVESSDVQRDPVETALRAAAGTGIRTGASDIVELRRTGTGYEQAFHALAVARHGPEPFVAFSGRTELAALLDPAGRAWASHVLRPLVDFVPERPQDPDSHELLTTLRSWLHFQGGAARQLKIHRNTLAARVRHAGAVLGLDLDRIGTRAELHLALRLVTPGPRRGTTEVAELLAAPAVRRWAKTLLAPLLESDSLLDTVRAWLAADARLEGAADALGVSVTGTRKRLIRVEQLLGRSLLSGPSARYDLVLALRVHDAAS